jgi:hypothetical protein
MVIIEVCLRGFGSVATDWTENFGVSWLPHWEKSKPGPALAQFRVPKPKSRPALGPIGPKPVGFGPDPPRYHL